MTITKETSDRPHHFEGVTITPIQQMISSSTGALMTSLLMTPLDVVKIRLQAEAKPAAFSKGHCFLYCNGLMDHLCACVNGISPSSQWYKRPSQFKGTFDAMIKIARYEGITSLWSGLPPTLVMAIPATVIYFTAYEQMKAVIGNRDVVGESFQPMLAGSSARVWAATCISPIEMIRTKIQSEQLTYSQVLRALRDMMRANGILSLWRGLGPTLLRDVPFSAVYWTSYESMKSYVLSTTGRSNLKFHEAFSAGAVGGTFAAFMTLPFDVIKTRRQIEIGEKELIGNKKETTATWKIIRNIYKNEGLKALFTGLFPRLVKVAPSCAIMISTYEFFKHFFAGKDKSLTDVAQHPMQSFTKTPVLQDSNMFPPRSNLSDIEHLPVPIITSMPQSPSHPIKPESSQNDKPQS
ncbi:gata Zinc finger domain-containing protein 1 [Plakobranchus ocellatus]|uniref:Gata Zinc finger domain-containing protein 1 n=1 Tax=Plakobranchus ocellatus TaxID=259542 RepID=A0AAV3Y0X7_9GAST|nr:gata Zinc finger domain-containing protein 1 [Plakobranchus ocellatus]